MNKSCKEQSPILLCNMQYCVLWSSHAVCLHCSVIETCCYVWGLSWNGLLSSCWAWQTSDSVVKAFFSSRVKQGWSAKFHNYCSVCCLLRVQSLDGSPLCDHLQCLFPTHRSGLCPNHEAAQDLCCPPNRCWMGGICRCLTRLSLGHCSAESKLPHSGGEVRRSVQAVAEA